jgi:hypothetical protein
MLSPRTARGNRFGLAILGLLLVAGGVFGLGQAANAWFSGSKHQPLITSAETRYVHHHDWLWAVAAGAAAVIVVICLRWLLVQARRSNISTLVVESDAGAGRSTVGAAVVAQAVSDELSLHPDVVSARAEITGVRRDPELRVTVTAAEASQVPAIRRYLETEVLVHATHALDLDHVPPTHVTIAFA